MQNKRAELLQKAIDLANQTIASFSEDEIKNYAFDKLVDEFLKKLGGK